MIGEARSGRQNCLRTFKVFIDGLLLCSDAPFPFIFSLRNVCSIKI
jgi:hypothetical protein